AFTDYQSQGQTILCAIVDIGTQPTGGLTPSNAYVQLSHSSGSNQRWKKLDEKTRLWWEDRKQPRAIISNGHV
ncbi:hypothetical protein JB92DRAFT_2707695, partial [Gautieria morchelliformis]